MKLLMLNYEYPPIGGGGGIIAKNIAEQLVKNNFQVSLVTASFKNLPATEIINGVQIFRVKCWRKYAFQSNPIEMLSWVKSTKKFLTSHLRQNQYALCFANFVRPGGDVAIFLKKKFNLPYVVISHGHDIPWVNARKQWPLYLASFFTIKKILRNAQLVFVQTREMQQNLLDTYPRFEVEKLCKINNGFWLPDISKNSTPQNNNFNIAFIGRLVHQKDPITCLEGFQVFAQNHPNAKLHFFGDGPLKNQLQKLVLQQKLNQSVKFYGKIEQTKLLNLLSTFDAAVFTTLNEGMSIAMLECAALGLPIITTQVSGVSEFIHDKNGIIIRFKKPKDVAVALQKIANYQHQQIPFPAEAEVIKFKQKFNWAYIGLMYADTLKHAVSP